MKSEIRHPLDQVSILSIPALAKGTTIRAYLDVLKSATSHPDLPRHYRGDLTLKAFERWLLRSASEGEALIMDEGVIDEFRQDLKAGRFKRPDGNAYGSLARTMPQAISKLHNLAADGGSPVLCRKLLSRIVWGRLRRFGRLNELTQNLMIHIERTGSRASRKKRRVSRPMTEVTRREIIDSTILLLEMLGRMGVDEVRREDITALMDTASAENNHKRVSRILHSASTVFRIAFERGDLPENVLDDVDHDTFSDTAQRDYLMPDQIGKIHDLDSLDWRDSQAVTDRLVVLLLYDLAIRRSELSSLLRDDVICKSGRYDVLLRPEVQKGHKPSISLRVLFPSTEKLLAHYLKLRGNKPGALLYNTRGKPASAGFIEKSVKRESERLQLICEPSGKLPSPHVFRRTFATINSAPLGLALGIDELAYRLRDSIRVVDESYRQQNPLIQSMKQDLYHDRIADGTTTGKEGILKAIELLDRAGLPSKLCGQIKRWQEKRFAPPVADEQPCDAWVWISEKGALAILRNHWGRLPPTRSLRKYFRDMSALRRSGPRGAVEYREDKVCDLAKNYLPLLDHMTDAELRDRRVKEMLGELGVGGVGAYKWIAVQDLPQLSVFLRGLRASGLTRNKTCTSELSKRAHLAA